MPGNTITVSNTFVAGTRAKSAEVNTNFSDLTSGLSAGDKDISVGTVFRSAQALTSVDNTLSGLTITGSHFFCTPPTTTGMNVYLPSAAGYPGAKFDIKKSGDTTGAVNISAADSSNIDNTTTVSLTEYLESISVISDGSQYHRISPHDATYERPGLVKKNRYQHNTWGSIAATAGSSTNNITNLVDGNHYEVFVFAESFSRASTGGYALVEFMIDSSIMCYAGLGDTGVITEQADSIVTGNKYMRIYNSGESWQIRYRTGQTGDYIQNVQTIITELNNATTTTDFM